MFFSSSSKKDEGGTIAVIDIGSAQVSGAIIKLKTGREIETVLAQADEKIPFQDAPDFDHFWYVTNKALNIVLKELRLNMATSEPRSIFVFLSSPFFQSQTKIIKCNSPSLVKITKNCLADLVKKATSEIKDNENNIILEDRIMQTKLDGYLTTWPLGQRAKEIGLSHFLSWADKNLLINIRDTIRSEYAKVPIFFNSFSYAIYDVFKDFLPDKDFILLDTGNEITDILVVKDNILAEHLSFPKGRNYLIRQIAQSLNTIQAEAETSLTLYASGQANSQLTTRLVPTLNIIAGQWQLDFKTALTRALETTFLPETIYLISDDPTDNLFAQFIDQADLHEVTISNHKLTTIFIEKLLADGLAHLTGKNQPLTNTWLLAEAIFCAKIKEI